VKPYRKLEELRYILLGVRRIRINVGIRQGHHLQGSKNDVLKFLSVNNIVIAPANTGNDNNNKKAVMKTAQTINGVL
jgi:hypothetical protein